LIQHYAIKFVSECDRHKITEILSNVAL